MLLWASAVSNRHSSIIPPSPSKKYILIFITYSYAFIRFSRIFFSLINQRLNQDDSTGGPTLTSLIFRGISEYFIISFPHKEEVNIESNILSWQKNFRKLDYHVIILILGRGLLLNLWMSMSELVSVKDYKLVCNSGENI